MANAGGYENIYRDLLERLESINLAEAAEILGLAVNDAGQVEVPFLGQTYWVGSGAVLGPDGKEAPTIHGSVLAGYVITRGRGEPTERYVPLDKLTELAPSSGGFSDSILEPRLARYAEHDPLRFEQAVEKAGGRPGGEVGSGGRSWILRPLPKMPAQLVLYLGDDEFPSRARLLFDLTATNFLEFEFLTVMAHLLVMEIGRRVNRNRISDSAQ